MISHSLRETVFNILNRSSLRGITLQQILPVGGGSVNRAYFIDCGNVNFFIKINDAGKFPGMFVAEEKGIQMLQQTQTFRVPEVIATGDNGIESFILMQWIDSAGRVKNYSEKLGTLLAQLHRFKSTLFGLNYTNYIGILEQSNQPHYSGCEFMIEERFKPMVKMAIDKKLLSDSCISLFENFYKNLPSVLPDEAPSLLHGDLWNGNVITGPDGEPWLIDPSVYYGYRETDLAMTRLFGGFNAEFYESYNETFPLQPEWQKRVELFQLYPLLVHLNLFGVGYKEGVMQAVGKYC